MVAKTKSKKVTEKVQRTGKAQLEFTIDASGMLRTEVKFGKKTDERLAKAAGTASALFLQAAQKAGGVLVNIGGQLICAEPVTAQILPPSPRDFSELKRLGSGY